MCHMDMGEKRHENLKRSSVRAINQTIEKEENIDKEKISVTERANKSIIKEITATK